jgi:hypothetical protein
MTEIDVPDWVVEAGVKAMQTVTHWESHEDFRQKVSQAVITAALGAWVVPKPLEWRELSDGPQVAVTPWRSDYWITFPVLGYGAGKVQASFLDAREPWAELFDSVEEAKSAVFTNHAKKIAALTALRQEKPE